jgi:hypothetical protein
MTELEQEEFFKEQDLKVEKIIEVLVGATTVGCRIILERVNSIINVCRNRALVTQLK